MGRAANNGRNSRFPTTLAIEMYCDTRGKLSVRGHCDDRTVRLPLVATLVDGLVHLYSISGTVELQDAIAIALEVTSLQAVFQRILESRKVFSTAPRSTVALMTAFLTHAAAVRRSRSVA